MDEREEGRDEENGDKRSRRVRREKEGGLEEKEGRVTRGKGRKEGERG